MNTSRRILAVVTVALSVVCGIAYAQVNSRPLRGMRFQQPASLTASGAAPTPNPVQRDIHSESVPALSLTFGIYTFPGTVGSFTAEATKSGHIVGGYGLNVNSNTPSDHGFILKGTKFTSLDYPGSVYTQPNAVNNTGVIVGAYGTTLLSADEHGFKLVNGIYSSIDYPGATEGTFASGINKAGDIVGNWGDNTTVHGFLLSNGVFTTIDVPGAFYTVAWGINNKGDITGWYGANFSESHGFIYSKGSFTTLDYPGYTNNYVADINDNGLVAGGFGNIVTINGVQWQWEHAYVYQNGVFTTFDVPFGPPALTEIWHLNDSGVISGFYADNTSTVYGFEATVGP